MFIITYRIQTLGDLNRIISGGENCVMNDLIFYNKNNLFMPREALKDVQNRIVHFCDE